MRAVPAANCSTTKTPNGALGIVRYAGSDPSTDPTTTGYPVSPECADETQLVPVVPKNAGQFAYGNEVDIAAIKDNYVKFTINGSSLLIDWSNPTLLLADNRDPTYPSSYNVVSLNGTDDTVDPLFSSLMVVDIFRCSVCRPDHP